MKKTIITALTVVGLTVLGATQAEAKEVKDNGNIYYIVESGDVLSEIAKKYDTTYLHIHGNNSDKIENPDNIFVGEKFLVGGKDFDENNVAQPVVVAQAPVVEQAVEVAQAAPAQSTYVAPAQTQPATQSQPAQSQSSYTSNASGSEAEAKSWIAFKESTNNYNATNGRYIGKYQLTDSYLNGDYSPENQERVADAYVKGRYGSWQAAKSFWLANGWY